MKSQAHVVKIGKSAQLAFGLQWSTLPGAGKQSVEVKKLVKDNKADRVVVFNRNGGSKALVGLLGNDKGIKGDVIAAGVIFARMAQIPNAMFLYRFPDGVCVFIGILDGMPMPGYDGFGVAEDIKDLLTRFVGLRQGIQLKLFGNVELEGMEAPRALSPEELVSAPRKVLKEAVLNTTEFPIRVVYGAVIFAAGVVAAYGGYVQWHKYVQTRQVAAKPAEVDPNVWYRGAVPPLLERADYPANKVVENFLDALGDMPLFHAGWELSFMKCTSGVCETTWKILKGGSFSSFKEAMLPRLENVVYQQDLKTITATISFELPKGSKGQKEESMPKQSVFEFEQDDSNQKRDGSFPSILRKPALNLITVPPNIDESRLTNVINVGDWELRGPLYQANILKTLPDNMTLEVVEATFTPSAFTVLCQGKYYVKK